MSNHDQARNAAAQIAFPDPAHQTRHGGGNWGNRIILERLAGYSKPRLQHGGQNRGIPNWTLEDSRQALEAHDTPTRSRRSHTCIQCGVTFTPAKRQSRGKTPRFCSVQCYGLSRRAKTITLPCAHCDTPFQIKEFDLKKNQKYCSHACHNTARSRR